ncbi:MAG: hypothetical protein ABL999_01615 [Pyrinomonadaceae bacterium]
MKLNRRDAETRRIERTEQGPDRTFSISCIHFFLFSLCLCVSAVGSSCTSKPSDLRTLVPAETLIYLETNDLAAAIQPILDSDAFKQAAKTTPDLSALKGVQLAVAVTGFETSEERLTDENSVGRVQPRFVAVADTHAWNYQAVAFAEKKLSGFVADVYQGEPQLEKTEKLGGKYFTWTAKDGRKAFALVIDSLIYFGNDASAIEKCVAVKKGEADSIAKTGKPPNSVPNSLASGYVSTDGVAQIAALAGLSFATQASDDEEVQSAVAGILPKLIRGTVTDASWTAMRSPQGYEDKWQVTMPQEIASVFNESFAIQEELGATTYQKNELIAQLPENVFTATHYNLKDPRLAWLSFIQAETRNLNPIEGKILAEFSSLLFEPYGIKDPALFLGSFGDSKYASRSIITGKLDEGSEENVAILAVGDLQSRKRSLSPDLKPPKEPIEGGINTWSSEEEDLQVIFDSQMIRIGSKENLVRVSGSRLGELNDIRGDLLRRLATSKAPIATVGRETTTTLSLVDLLANEGHGDVRPNSTYFTETRFTNAGVDRVTTSDFGFIGTILAQLTSD